jgi:hypothetical protein
MSRPCRYCLAAYPEVAAEICELEHRDERRVYDLAAAMAHIFQPRPNTDEQVQWFLSDADAVAGDFDPVPEKWQVRKLPDDFSEFIARLRINGFTYVLQDGDGKVPPVRLSSLRKLQRAADTEAARRLAAG